MKCSVFPETRGWDDWIDQINGKLQRIGAPALDAMEVACLKPIYGAKQHQANHDQVTQNVKISINKKYMARETDNSNNNDNSNENDNNNNENGNGSGSNSPKTFKNMAGFRNETVSVCFGCLSLIFFCLFLAERTRVAFAKQKRFYHFWGFFFWCLDTRTQILGDLCVIVFIGYICVDSSGIAIPIK